ncbi:MAG: hypothetical protein PHN56_02565 [Candidatus Nanoarchaeia archaeon]|nr:hypothetical protein [Candidatus Nanoarchaeia archaeon]
MIKLSHVIIVGIIYFVLIWYVPNIVLLSIIVLPIFFVIWSKYKTGKIVKYNRYNISEKELHIYSDHDSATINYYNITDMWIDEKRNEISININEELKKTGKYDDKLTKEYYLKCKEGETAIDFGKIMNLSRLVINMNKPDSEKRNKKIKELFESNRLDEF